MPQDYSLGPKPRPVNIFPQQSGNGMLAQLERRMTPMTDGRIPKKIHGPSTYFHKGQYDSQYQRAGGPDRVAEFMEAEAADNAQRLNEYEAKQAKNRRAEMDHQRRTYPAMEKRGVYPFAKEQEFGMTALGGSSGAYPNQGKISAAMQVKNTKPGK